MTRILSRSLSYSAPRGRRLVVRNVDEVCEELLLPAVNPFGRLGHRHGKREILEKAVPVVLDPLLPRRGRRHSRGFHKKRCFRSAVKANGEVPILLVKELLGGPEDLLIDRTVLNTRNFLAHLGNEDGSASDALGSTMRFGFALLPVFARSRTIGDVVVPALDA